MKARKTRSASAKTRSRYAKTLRALGLTPYPFQVDLLARADDVFMLGASVPRQNGKSEFEIMAAFITALRGGDVMVFAHNRDLTAALAHRFMAYARPMKDQGLVTRVTESVNINSCTFTSGGTVTFKIRGTSVGVGLTLDRIIFDEAQKMDSRTIEDVMPTTTRAKHPSIIMIGTPPTADDLKVFGTDTPFIKQRAKGGAGWVEYGIGDYHPDHAAFTLKDARESNPAWKKMPHFTDTVKREKATLSDRAYARQRLGAWVMPDTVEYHPPEMMSKDLASIMSSRGPAKDVGLFAGVGVYPDSSSAFLSFSDGVHYEIIGEVSVEGGDLSSLTSFILEKSRHFRSLVIPANGRGKALSGMLAARGLVKKISLSTTTETATRIQQLTRKMHAGEVRVFKNDSASLALGSFWKGFDPRAGAVTVEAMDPSARAAMLSLVLAFGEPPRDGVVGGRSFAV